MGRQSEERNRYRQYQRCVYYFYELVLTDWILFVYLGENINITWSADGNSIAVGNKEDLVTFIDARTFKIHTEQQFKFEVNEIEWNKSSNLFFLTSGQGCIHILELVEERLPRCE